MYLLYIAPTGYRRHCICCVLCSGRKQMWLLSGRCNSKARLDGKVVIVTGANCGIGKATALDFVRRGEQMFDVYFCYGASWGTQCRRFNSALRVIFVSWGFYGGRCVTLTILLHSCADCLENLEASTFWRSKVIFWSKWDRCLGYK